MNSKQRSLATLLALGLLVGAGFAIRNLTRRPAAAAPELAPVQRDEPAGVPARAEPLAVAEFDTDDSTRDGTSRRADAPSADGALLLHGRVSDERGLPVPDARVWVREIEDPERPAGERESSPRDTSSDNEGAFSALVDGPGNYCLWATRRGAASGLVFVELDGRAAPDEVVLRLSQPRAIAGVVLGEDMQPLVGIEVVAYVDVEGLGIALPANTTSVELYGRPKTLTGVDGSFRLTPVLEREQSYVVEALRKKNIRRSRLRNGAGIPGVLESFWRERLPAVPAGRQGLTMVLAAPGPGTPSLLLEFSSEDGGGLPGFVSGMLRHVGPNGGVYHDRPLNLSLDERGTVRIPNVEAGARYQLELTWTGQPEWRKLPAFVAASGETRVPVVLEGLFTLTVRLDDPRGTLAEGGVIAVTHINAKGRRRSVLNSSWGPDQRELELRLCEGTYDLQVSRRNNAASRSERLVTTQRVELPAADTELTLEIP